MALLPSAGSCYGIGAAETGGARFSAAWRASVCQFTAKCFQRGQEPQAAILQKHLADWQTTCSSFGAAINLPSSGKDTACNAQPLAALQMPRSTPLFSWRGSVCWKSRYIQLFTRSALKIGQFFFFFPDSTSCFQLKELEKGMTYKPLFYPSLN